MEPSNKKKDVREIPVDAQVRIMNLKILMKQKYGDKQVNLARALLRQPDYVSRLLKGTKLLSGDMAREFERLLELPKYYLDGQRIEDDEDYVNAVDHDRSGTGFVPLIPWDKVVSTVDVSRPYKENFATDWLPCPKRDCGRYTFALRVAGQANEGPGRYTYREGDIIFVDPEIEGKNGARIITELPDSSEISLRQLIFEGKSRYLKTLNPSWPDSITKVAKVISYGVVIGKWVDESNP